MTIHVEDLKFQCIIGMLDFERVNPQDVIVNALIEYEYDGDYINYVEIVEIIKSKMKSCEFLLIEDALEQTTGEIVIKFSQIKKMDMKISKPSILEDCKVSVSNQFIRNLN